MGMTGCKRISLSEISGWYSDNDLANMPDDYDYDSPLTDLEDSTDANSEPEYSSLEETFSESSGSEYGGKTSSNCYSLFLQA